MDTFPGHVDAVLWRAIQALIFAIDKERIRRAPLGGRDQKQVGLGSVLQNSHRRQQVRADPELGFLEGHLIGVADRLDLHIPVAVRVASQDKIDASVVDLGRVDVEAEQHELHLDEVLGVASDLQVGQAAPEVLFRHRDPGLLSGHIYVYT